MLLMVPRTFRSWWIFLSGKKGALREGREPYLGIVMEAWASDNSLPVPQYPRTEAASNDAWGASTRPLSVMTNMMGSMLAGPNLFFGTMVLTRFDGRFTACDSSRPNLMSLFILNG